MRRSLSLFLPSVAAVVFGSFAAHADIGMSRGVTGTGGGLATSASYTVNGTAGQPAIGVISGPANSNEAGFWYQPGEDLSGIADTGPESPARYWLGPNSPNPFRPHTVLQFSLPKTCRVTIKIYDTRGREVATIVHGDVPAGYHTEVFGAEGLAGGVYFCRMQADQFVQTRKMVVLR
jgi:hypothetical protein